MRPMPSPPFARPRRFAGGQVVEPGAGMGVDDAEGGVLRLQPLDQERQDGVLDHVGEAAGVEGVAVVHGAEVVAPVGRSAGRGDAVALAPIGSRPARSSTRTRPEATSASACRVEPMLRREHARGERLRRIAGKHRHGRLRDDRPVVDGGSHEMHRAAVLA